MMGYRGHLGLAVLATLALGLRGALGCSTEAKALARSLAEGCLLSSDCADGLVCSFRVCHLPCVTSKDCPAAAGGGAPRCVVADKPARVCQLDDERACERGADCPAGLVCAVDAQCHSRCSTHRDCLADQRCAGGACADVDELDAEGRLPVAPDVSGEGRPCQYHSDCLPGVSGRALSCRDGACAPACVGSDRDCEKYERCTTDGAPHLAGECVPIGDASTLYCSPKADHPAEAVIACACPDGTAGEQRCAPDGSTYEPCTQGDSPCNLP